jgi:uncharacterized protein (TIGR00266 family)
MQFDISGNPDYGDLTIVLDAGETVRCESGAMSRMSTGLNVQGRLTGGMVAALARKVLGGESLFLAEYTASGPSFVSLSPSFPGTVLRRPTEGEPFYLTRGSFLACTPEVRLSTRFGGLRSLFSGEGAFVIQCSGRGELFFNAYGAVIEKRIDGSFTVDTGHVVGWEPSLDYTITGMGGLKQTLFSGEGLVMKFSGAGTVYLQSRHLGGLAGWLRPYLSA